MGAFFSAHVLGMSLGCPGSGNTNHCLVTDGPLKIARGGSARSELIMSLNLFKITMISNRLIQDGFFFFLKEGIFSLDVSLLKEMGRRWDPTTPAVTINTNPSFRLNAGDRNDPILGLWVRKLFYCSQQITSNHSVAIMLNELPKKLC